MRQFGRLATFLSFALLLVAWDACAQPTAGRRVALVIGNGSYRSVDRLANPANDARLIARTLQGAGFTLVGNGPQIDLDKARFDRLVQSFGRLLQGADVALFYYSGHGMQVQGANWLVPVDANPTSSRDLDFQGIDASLILRQMEGSGTKLNIMVLDACRNNPFSVRGVRATAGGLAEMRVPEGTLISYATQPGNVAADGAGADSPYTAALAKAIRQPGLDVFQIFNQVGLSVKEATAGQQQPWVASSPIAGQFYFLAPATITQGSSASAETVFWQSISGSRNPADFQAYLRRYPNGAFSELAQIRLAAFAAPPVASDGGSQGDRTLRSSVQLKVGETKQIAVFGGHWRDCSAGTLPSGIQVVQPPELGVLTRHEDIPYVVQHSIGGTCEGSHFLGIGFDYTARAPGSETVTIEVRFDNESFRRVISVTVNQ